MPTDLRESYFETDILHADNCKLVLMLFHGAVQAVRNARRHLAAGEIRPRSRNITKASEILNELALSVDHQTGGELSRNLVELYAYIQTLLQKGNAEQTDAPLAEAEQLLLTLTEAWEACRPRAARSCDAAAITAAQYERIPVDCVG